MNHIAFENMPYYNATSRSSDRPAYCFVAFLNMYESIAVRITTADYDKYVTKYKAERDELEYKLVEYTNNDKSFILTAEHLLRLAQNAQTIFQSSQPAQKNKILKTLLANCKIDQKRLQLNLLKPFGSIIADAKSQSWLPLVDVLRNFDSGQVSLATTGLVSTRQID